ncbi:MAG TPA: formate--tetrahydrofolate ligase [Solirubrobacteraceae bacterium]|nr:formate--tetrahydrofolate ligase [Solirubrobacteraceae bacterium]
MKSSLEIAQEATLRPILDIAEEIGLQEDEVHQYGRYKAKVDLSVLERLRDKPDGKLIDVTGMTPTKFGEGKSTTCVSLTQGLGKIGTNACYCTREPSVGPVFGMKGGAAGAGYAQVVPMEDLNLHLNGDLHAITAANNLLAAIIDAHILQGNELGLDPLSVSWRRCVDVDDRALRQIVIGLGGRVNGIPRQTGFDITAASEVMAILGMASDLFDLRRRLGAITVGTTFSGEPVTADDLKAAGSMTVLMRDAVHPNLVQTLEGQPAFMHAGPFANIAHGNNSVVADRVALKVCDYVVTESGFGSDLGMEKFMDIVCPAGNLKPDACVLVCTVRALKHHGSHGGHAEDPHATRAEGLQAIEDGMANLRRHLENVKAFGVPCVVAVNRFPGDTDEECQLVRRLALEAGAFAAAINEGPAKGGDGATELAEAVIAATEQPSNYKPLYEPEAPIRDKIETVARRIYGADGVHYYQAADEKIAAFQADGLGDLPVCMAKTQYSLSADPTLLNAPHGFEIPIRDVRAYTGAGWLVPLAGDIMQMPGLSKTAAAYSVDIDEQGRTVGLF